MERGEESEENKEEKKEKRRERRRGEEREGGMLWLGGNKGSLSIYSFEKRKIIHKWVAHQLQNVNDLLFVSYGEEKEKEKRKEKRKRRGRRERFGVVGMMGF